MKDPINIFWFRRDLRIDDNQGLFAALNSDLPVLGIFIFDTHILDKLDRKTDARVQFIHAALQALNQRLKEHKSSLLTLHGKPEIVFKELMSRFDIDSVFYNRDYEPYAKLRDHQVGEVCKTNGINFLGFKDQVIFEKDEILKDDGKPYTVYTPYARKWKAHYMQHSQKIMASETLVDHFIEFEAKFPSLEELGFSPSSITVPKIKIDLNTIATYEAHRNFPSIKGTTFVGTHLRFGTISIRKLAELAVKTADVYLNELIWREFFMQIMAHFPHVVDGNYNPKYNRLVWRNDETDFKNWCEGKTGYPIVDAGMRELQQTGMMHNRVRMITASFLAKHLLIDWRWGEAWFASHLLDYELSSNNGNWQWAAGTGCDAAPYFRIFSPAEQQKKFDSKGLYVRKWLPELDSLQYPRPIVDHKFARERALKTYKHALEN